MAFKFNDRELTTREREIRSILKKRKAKGQTFYMAALNSGYSVSTLKRWASQLDLDDEPVSK